MSQARTFKVQRSGFIAGGVYPLVIAAYGSEGGKIFAEHYIFYVDIDGENDSFERGSQTLPNELSDHLPGPIEDVGLQYALEIAREKISRKGRHLRESFGETKYPPPDTNLRKADRSDFVHLVIRDKFREKVQNVVDNTRCHDLKEEIEWVPNLPRLVEPEQ